MKLFLSDLDNTLIYSHRRDIGPHKQHVEWYEDRWISYMTKESRELLNIVRKKILFIPCTTRSIAQYQRITLLPDWQPEYALVSNGGILLKHGQIEQNWYAESLERHAAVKATMEQAQYLLEQQTNLLLPVHMVDQLFLFTKSATAENLQHYLRQHLDLTQVQVLLHGQKLYVVPQTLTKGVALERLREQYPSHYIYAAGDSCFDVPMLCKADFAFAPAALSEMLHDQPHKYLIDEHTILSEAILNYLCDL